MSEVYDPWEEIKFRELFDWRNCGSWLPEVNLISFVLFFSSEGLSVISRPAL